MNTSKIIVFIMAATLVFTPLCALAHDAYLTTALDGVGILQEVEHADDNPFKGLFELTVTNNGSIAWGDFHFLIFDARGIDSSSVIFTDQDPDGLEDWTPVSSQNGSYSIGTGGHTLDFEFYGDPVNPGETAQFTVYTDNTSQQLDFFGIGYYATPMPIPGAAILLLSGLLVTLGIKKR